MRCSVVATLQPGVAWIGLPLDPFDLAVEQLVQDIGIEGSDVFITVEGKENSSGREAGGADAESGHPGIDAGGAPSLAGAISVSVDLPDEADVARVRSALEQHGGEDIATE